MWGSLLYDLYEFCEILYFTEEYWVCKLNIPLLVRVTIACVHALSLLVFRKKMALKLFGIDDSIPSPTPIGRMLMDATASGKAAEGLPSSSSSPATPPPP